MDLRKGRGGEGEEGRAGDGGEERGERVLGLGEGDSPPPCLPLHTLTENQSTWLKLPWEWEGPHFRRAVPPTSTSTDSGVGGSASPGTPGVREGTPQQCCQLQLLPVASPHSPLPAAVLPGDGSALPTLNRSLPAAPGRPVPQGQGG